MKKKLLGLMLLLAPYITYSSAIVHVHGHKPAPTIYTHTYTPAHGLLQLVDTTVPGVITQSLSNPSLTQASGTIARFAATVPGATTYQDIMAAIAYNPGNQLATDALRAFEQVIMHLYHYEAYAIDLSYSPWRSMLIGNGIRYEWFKPLSWINPKSWLSDNNKKLEQLICELDQLADIARQHSLALSTRMKMTVQSYRNWRNGIIALLVLYLGLDACRNNEPSIIKTAANNFAEDAYNIADITIDISSQAACTASEILSDAVSTTLNTTADVTYNTLNSGCELASSIINTGCNTICNGVSTTNDVIVNSISNLKPW